MSNTDAIRTDNSQTLVNALAEIDRLNDLCEIRQTAIEQQNSRIEELALKVEGTTTHARWMERNLNKATIENIELKKRNQFLMGTTKGMQLADFQARLNTEMQAVSELRTRIDEIEIERRALLNELQSASKAIAKQAQYIKEMRWVLDKIVNRWNSPDWSNGVHTGAIISEAKAVIGKCPE